MHKYVFLSFLLSVGFLTDFAQDTSHSLKMVVDHPVYFDISPPLRDMLLSPPSPVDLSWKDGVVMNYFRYPEDGTGQGNYQGIDLALQDHDGFLPGDTTIQNFEGLWNVSGYVPPDTYGEAGPNNYFQVVNCSYAIFNKTGERIFGPYANSSIWNGLPNNANSGDAVVHYDENANRWLFTQFSLPYYPNGPFFQMIAVSQTPDPMGSWYRWEYEFDEMPDYPKFGVWPDGYYMSANLFGNYGWSGNGAYAYDRTAMLTGNPSAQRISFEMNPGSAGFITLYPSDCDWPFPPVGTPNYFGYIKTCGTQMVGIYEFHADFTNPSNSTFGNLLNLNVTPFSLLQNGIPQLGTNKLLETLGDRLMYRLQFRKFSGYWAMVVNHSVNAGSGRSGVRWYELRKTTGPWSIYQQSTYAPADNHSRWMGSIAMDTSGTIALGYSVSGTTMYPAIRYTGRLKSDPLNQMTVAERTIINGGGCQTGSWSGRSRWGDYSGMSIDPSNPTTFWYTTEYYAYTSVSSWQTRIGSFTFDDIFSSYASATPASLCLGDSSQLEAFAYGGSGTYTYSWTSLPPGFTSSQSDPVVSPTQSTTYIVTINDGIQTRHDTVIVKVTPPPYAVAGNDTVVCSWVHEIELHGEASNYKRIVWGTTGDGTFSQKDSLNTLYYPGPEDKTSGGVDIKLVAFAINPCSGKLFSNKHVTIDPCTGIPQPDSSVPELIIYPNPSHGETEIVIKGFLPAGGWLTITGMDGKIIRSELINVDPVSRSKKINCHYSKGIYVVRLITESVTLQERMMIE